MEIVLHSGMNLIEWVSIQCLAADSSARNFLDSSDRILYIRYRRRLSKSGNAGALLHLRPIDVLTVRFNPHN
jgi:hypothetical protein